MPCDFEVLSFRERENNVLSPKYARPVERAVQCLHRHLQFWVLPLVFVQICKMKYLLSAFLVLVLCVLYIPK